MPPNKKGGKNYKKGKHADAEPIMYERLEGQMYGRILKLLGGCNALVFCNDNKERLCHIRGNMRKKVWLNTGDIVLISTRDLSEDNNNKGEKGDICARYDPKVIYKLREKDKTINEKLFLHIEKMDNTGNKSGNIPVTGDEDGFIFEDADGNEVVDSDSESENNGTTYANRTAQQRAMMADDDDINIDDI